ncbi:hypothetical protein OTU49_005639 [Cherax quadricarinatus]|uniref:Fibronectin type-III domain-containing protein n=1 Tax=Cherax quadricarinatus TaxID=27406 RepID=A0AAW0WSZ6_CHEQU
MYSTSDKIVSVAGLGRTFRLGMLYDCTKDEIIPGKTLWDRSTLKEIDVLSNESSDFRLIISDSMEEKVSAFDVNSSLKLSLVSGMVEVSRSGKYLENKKYSDKQERITVHYKCTTRSEYMTMDQLGPGKVQYPDIIDEETATHVVTEILYGAHAFFVFERDCCSSHDKETLGAMQVMLNKIPNMSVVINDQLYLSNNEKKIVENYKCTFIGDFLLPQNPCSYEDVVRIYKHLPTFLGDNRQNAVPIKVTLYPLTRLGSKGSRLVRNISTNLTSEIEKVFENFQELNVRCNDIYNSYVAEKMKTLQSEISKFKTLINIYKCELQSKLSVLLPRIKGGREEEYLLEDLLRKKEASPFSYKKLNSWLQDKEDHVKTLNKYIDTLSEIKFASDHGELKSFIMNPENNCNYILCLRIILPKNNSYLSKMEKYNRNEYYTTNDYVAIERNLEDNTLSSKDEDNQISMMEGAIIFRDFFNFNKKVNETAFVVSMGFSDTLNCQANIECYRLGRLLYKNYILPSAPGMPQADLQQSTHNRITITWTPPKFGASTVQEYEIILQKMSTGDNPVSFKTSSDILSFTVTELDVNSCYKVNVRSLCEAGVGPTSETNTVSTRPTSPPGMPQVWQISSTTIKIEWSKPLSMGSDCSIQHYILKQQKEETDIWTTIATVKADQLTYVTNITSNFESKFKVAADCGAAGFSEDSNCSSLKTHDAIQFDSSKMLKENFCSTSNLKLEGTPSIYTLKSRLVFCNDNDDIRKYDVGTPKENSREKVILLIGARDSGKTTVINGLVNYIFGVKWNDNFRFQLIPEDIHNSQTQDRTQHITCYTIHHQEGFNYPHTLTIIDIALWDEDSYIRMWNVFWQHAKEHITKTTKIVQHVDAAVFVVNSSLTQLPLSHIYFSSRILSMCEKDIHKVFLLLTSVNGQQPQVLSAVEKAKFPHKILFKFNNSALYTKNNEDVRSTAEEEQENLSYGKMFWHMAEKNYKAFLKQVHDSESRSPLGDYLLNYNEQILSIVY